MRHAVGGVHSPVCNIHYPPGPHSPAKMFMWKPYSSLIAILKIDPWDPLGCMRFMIMWSFQLNLGCLCIAWYHQAIHPYLSIKSVWAFLYGKCVCGILIDIDFEISEINRDKQNSAYSTLPPKITGYWPMLLPSLSPPPEHSLAMSPWRWRGDMASGMLIGIALCQCSMWSQMSSIYISFFCQCVYTVGGRVGGLRIKRVQTPQEINRGPLLPRTIEQCWYTVGLWFT